MNTNIRNINNILNHINSIKRGTHKKKGICILLGAGADLSSGGILFRELKLRFLRENDCEVPTNVADKILDKKFEEQVEKLTQDSRCETLDSIMKRYKQPSEGYSLLVMLAELGFIDAIITTNFDYLLEETQKMLNVAPFTIFTPGRATPEKYYMHRDKIGPIYLKMHGDIYDRLVTHLTQNELCNKPYGNEFIKLIKHIFQNNSIIVVGYGGYDSLITEIFRQEINNLGEIYWCNISEPQDDSDLVKLLKQNNKLCYVNTSFDNLFQKLSSSLLKDAELQNINPVFLPTVVQTKIDNQITKFKERIGYSNKLIIRTQLHEKLESFLATYDNKCIAIIGKHNYGKSCFVYKAIESLNDINFLPIIYDHEYSILKSMAQALGYNTDTPFPLMYSFVKWRDETDKPLVFVIDNFFNADSLCKISTNQIKDFFNFLYVVCSFKRIQFIICFQNDIYNQLKQDNTFASFGNIISKELHIEGFSEVEVTQLLNQNGVTPNTYTLEKKKLLHIPYVWEIINRNKIDLTQSTDLFIQYTDSIYNSSTSMYSFTKHAFNTLLMELSYNQLFTSNLDISKTSQQYLFLSEKGIINSTGKIIYLELAIYYCKQYILKSVSWEQAVLTKIIPDLQKRNSFSNIQIDIYTSILAEVNNIDKYDLVLRNLDELIANQTESIYLKKIIIQVIKKCLKYNQELFKKYLQSVDINTYSFDLQYYLLKVCAELCPQILEIWNKSSEDKKLPYAAFILCNDKVFSCLRKCAKSSQLDKEILNQFRTQNGLIKVCHILTYFGWDNIRDTEYLNFTKTIVSEIFPIVQTDDDTVQHFVTILVKYAYNIFFNAGEDFEEQFISCRNTGIYKFAQKVVNQNCLTREDYLKILELNVDINNSWLFIVSNIIVVQSMKNQSAQTYDMLFHFWDNEQLDIQVQHLDFFLSSVFWALYICKPNNREMFVSIFEKISEKYESILFTLPINERKSSLHKFSEEFERMFEDGFNPLAFYFYTAPYSALTQYSEWDSGKKDLKLYWNWVQNLSELGKYDDMLRIVHALGQMISIYPDKGYSALANLTCFDQPIIKKGIIRIFKENYLRYSNITKEELNKEIYQLDSNDIEEIIYNSDFLLENRTLEQLHWGRLFYNLEQMLNINVSSDFLNIILQAQSCTGFLRDFIKNFSDKM